jgi:hypothetical protein
LKKPVDWYVGAGLKLRFFDDHNRDRHDDNDGDFLGIGVRVPLGLEFFIIPEVEIFGELVPGISLFPDTDFDLDGGIGARYYFNL